MCENKNILIILIKHDIKYDFILFINQYKKYFLDLILKKNHNSGWIYI